MSIQSIRKGIALLSVLLFPITYFYVAPAVVVEGAKHGVLTISLISIGVFGIIAFLFGRIYCAYACPVGAIQELGFRVNNKKVKGGKLNFIKFIFGFGLLAATVISLIKIGGFKTFDPLFKTVGGISIGKPELYATYYSGITMILAIALIIGRRAFCHYMCPVAPFLILGKFVRKIFKIKGFGYKAKQEDCASCGKCNEICPMSLDVKENVKKNMIDELECITCGECADVCPKQVITYK